MTFKKYFSRILVSLLCFICIFVSLLHYIILPYYDCTSNATAGQERDAVGRDIETFHKNTFVADLHADSLLWNRDLSQRNNYGHIDLPRLIESGVDLQVFSVVSKVPRSLNYHSNSSDTDILPVLFIAGLRSPLTWFSPKQRALAQASTLKKLVDTSPLRLILNKSDLAETAGTGSLLALEGMHALEGEAKALDEFFSEGFRMMGLTHFFDNEVAGSAHGVDQYGLTDLGRLLVPRMESFGITIDLAHASPNTIDDTLKLATRPVVVSHSGLKGTCPGPRNLSDDQLRGVAENGGIVGIGYWKGAVCSASVEGITKAILYAIRVAGIDHVGLGSDFDGHVTTPFDVTGLALLTESLLKSGLSKTAISKVLGGNVKRVLLSNLPDQDL